MMIVSIMVQTLILIAICCAVSVAIRCICEAVSGRKL